MPRISKITLMAAGAAVIAQAAVAGDVDYSAMSLSDLLSTPVVTSSRQEQKLSQSPSAISVITADDIKQSGAQTVAEAVSMAAGVDLRYGGQNTVGGGILGFDKLTINKIALMINGVPWENEVYSVPDFDSIPVTLSEIKRIEILKGPGSSLYGSGAMLGVINIITKDTSETQGTSVSYTGGDDRLYMGEVMTGNKIGNNFSYRFTASERSIDQTPPGTIGQNSPDMQVLPRINTTMDYKFSDGSKLNFFGAYVRVPNEDWFINEDMVDTALSYTKDSFNIKGTWQQKHGELYDSPVMTGTASLDAQDSITVADKNTAVVGANFTQQSADAAGIGGMRKQNTGGFFIDDSQKLTDKLTLDVGGRADENPVTNTQYSGRAALIYNLDDNNTLRYTWGDSYRNPNFAELYSVQQFPTNVSAFAPLGTTFTLAGDPSISGERAQMHDVGYMGKLSDEWNVSADVFVINVKNYITSTTTQYWDYIYQHYGYAIPETVSFDNLGSATEVGYTMETRYQPMEWLSTMANYTYYNYTDMSSGIGYLLTPQHLVNLQARAKFRNGISTNVQGHYTSALNSYNPAGETNYYTPPSFRVDARVGYDFKAFEHNMTFSVQAWDLFNASLQYMNPAGYDAMGSYTDMSRRLSATLACQF
jgi:iron complex outermembrane receptor protein